MPVCFRHVLLLALVFLTGHVVQAADGNTPRFTAGQIEYFETKVRPLLVEHCHQCHSEKAKSIKGGLRLDDRAMILKGGDSGATIIPGKPSESLLVKAVHWQTVEMPPKGKLKDAEIATLENWIQMGAPWPDAPAQALNHATRVYDWAKWRSHWAFRPVVKPALPPNADTGWSNNDIDRFVFAKLRDAGLKPALPASPEVLVRRIYFDLIGLPPSPKQVDAFVAEAHRDRKNAVRKLVDDLLASPHYGERWGRHWLDVARYSDGHGGFLDSNVYPEAWRYRDWVVQAFNNDMPFDTFLRLQIAGDLIGGPRDAVATGFFAIGPTYISDGGDPESISQARAETLSDRIDTLGRGMLGLTIACARCHDHKFDPLPTQDYYSLAGIFDNSVVQLAPIGTPEAVGKFEQHQKAVSEITQKTNKLRNSLKKENRTATDSEMRQLAAWDAQLADLKRAAPAAPAGVHVLKDNGSTDMKVAIRGDLRKTGEVAPRRFPRILAGDKPLAFDKGSGRLQLAAAVTDRNNPLTARVFINRVWLHHFGEGLVRTPSNFGALGEQPTHPELLDWLTSHFLDSGQSIKALHRVIMNSASYQMDSTFDDAAFKKDGDNRLLWRMNPRRLDVEAWRDSLLNVTGELDTALGGPPAERIDTPRRTLYFKVSRNGDVFQTDEFLRRFDFPLMRATVDQRPTSTVPQQYLFLMNSPFMLARAKALEKRLATMATTDRERIEFAYLLLYQRPATTDERDIGVEFLKTTPAANGLSAWDQYSHVLLAADEFMTVK